MVIKCKKKKIISCNLQPANDDAIGIEWLLTNHLDLATN